MADKILKVYVHATCGRIDCICLREKSCLKLKEKGCEPDKVHYDQYDGWQECMKQNKYGR